MVDVVLNDLFYILDRLLSLMFNMYIYSGVSIGMIFVVVFIFKILIQFLSSSPVIRKGASDGYEKGYRSSH